MLRRRMIFGGGIEDGGGMDANCVSLFHFDDNSNDAKNLLNLGIDYEKDYTPAYSSTIKKFGSSVTFNSMYNTAAVACYFYANDSTAWRPMFLGDFTIDYWMQSNKTGYYDIQMNKGNANYWILAGALGNLFRVKCDPYSFIGDVTFTFSANTWYHIAIVRASGMLKVYIDGIEKGSWSFPWNPTTEFVGRSDIMYSRNSYGYSRLDELRFSNKARWTKNFTPPTAAYA